MHIAVHIFQLAIPGCRSLKEKRMALKSLKSRLRNRFNVAVSETAFHDVHDRAEVAAVAVAGDRAGIDRLLDGVDDFVVRDGRVRVTSVSREYR